MQTQLESTLQTLSAAARGDHPVLSIYLDLAVDSTGQRQSVIQLNQEFNRLAGEFAERSPQRASFDSDRARVESYLENDIPLDARGVAIFASSEQNIWETIPLLVPVNTMIFADPYPHVFQLAQLLEDREPVAVALVEGQEAKIYLLHYDSMQQVESTAAVEKVNRVQVGGWSQLRYQNHTDHVIRSHMRDLNSKLQDVVDQHNVQHLIIASNDAMKGPIRETLSAQLRDRLLDHVPYEAGGDPEQIFKRLEPIMQRAEQQQEQQLLEDLEHRLASKGGLAVAGPNAVAQALSKGQVDTLLIHQSFSGVGAECPSCGILRLGQRERCPNDGSDMQPVDLREGLAAQTLRQGGRIEVIGIEHALEDHQGVAALLRFRDDIVPAEL